VGGGGGVRADAGHLAQGLEERAGGVGRWTVAMLLEGNLPTGALSEQSGVGGGESGVHSRGGGPGKNEGGGACQV
jgi:hypothetical protein